jgi:hypothetical protein
VTNFVADVENWMDLFSNLWVGLVLIAVAAVPAIISAKNAKGIKSIKDQVVNGHKESPNLREDLDKVIACLAENSVKVDLISNGLNGLRDELVYEEERRRSSIVELRADLDRRLDSLAQRIK